MRPPKPFGYAVVRCSGCDFLATLDQDGLGVLDEGSGTRRHVIGVEYAQPVHSLSVKLFRAPDPAEQAEICRQVCGPEHAQPRPDDPVASQVAL